MKVCFQRGEEFLAVGRLNNHQFLFFAATFSLYRMVALLSRQSIGIFQ
jgi:hypothetical protein